MSKNVCMHVVKRGVYMRMYVSASDPFILNKALPTSCDGMLSDRHI